MRRIVVRMTALALLTLPSTGFTHSGSALDDDGCHPDHRNGTYHCHRGAAAGYTFPDRNAMLEAVRTSNFPDKTVDEESFFSRLWPFGREDDPDEAAAVPADAGGLQGSATAPGNPAPGQNAYEQRLKILQGLYEMGLISREEYEAKRKAVLDEL